MSVSDNTVNTLLDSFPIARRCKNNTCPCENCNISGNICEECINVSSHYNWSTTNTPVIKCSNDACSNAYCIQCLIKEDPNTNPSTFRICSDFKYLQQQECTTNEDLFGNLLFSLFNELPSNISNDQYFKNLWSSENITQEGVFIVQRNIAKHYFSFKLNEYHYRIQDCVSIKTEGNDDSIARICDIFTTNDETLNCKLLVQWFLTPDQFRNHDKSSCNYRIDFGEKELVFESTYFDVLDIHTLDKKILVCNNATEQQMKDIRIRKFNCDRKRKLSGIKGSLMRARNPNVSKCLMEYGLNFNEFGDVFYCRYECGIGDGFTCIQESNTNAYLMRVQQELKEKYEIVDDKNEKEEDIDDEETEDEEDYDVDDGFSSSDHSLATETTMKNNRKPLKISNKKSNAQLKNIANHEQMENNQVMNENQRKKKKKNKKSKHIILDTMPMENNINRIESGGNASPDIVFISGTFNSRKKKKQGPSLPSPVPHISNKRWSEMSRNAKKNAKKTYHKNQRKAAQSKMEANEKKRLESIQTQTSAERLVSGCMNNTHDRKRPRSEIEEEIDDKMENENIKKDESIANVALKKRKLEVFSEEKIIIVDDNSSDSEDIMNSSENSPILKQELNKNEKKGIVKQHKEEKLPLKNIKIPEQKIKIQTEVQSIEFIITGVVNDNKPVQTVMNNDNKTILPKIPKYNKSEQLATKMNIVSDTNTLKNSKNTRTFHVHKERMNRFKYDGYAKERMANANHKTYEDYHPSRNQSRYHSRSGSRQHARFEYYRGSYQHYQHRRRLPYAHYRRRFHSRSRSRSRHQSRHRSRSRSFSSSSSQSKSKSGSFSTSDSSSSKKSEMQSYLEHKSLKNANKESKPSTTNVKKVAEKAEEKKSEIHPAQNTTNVIAHCLKDIIRIAQMQTMEKGTQTTVKDPKDKELKEQVLQLRTDLNINPEEKYKILLEKYNKLENELKMEKEKNEKLVQYHRMSINLKDKNFTLEKNGKIAYRESVKMKADLAIKNKECQELSKTKKENEKMLRKLRKEKTSLSLDLNKIKKKFKSIMQQNRFMGEEFRRMTGQRLNAQNNKSTEINAEYFYDDFNVSNYIPMLNCNNIPYLEKNESECVQYKGKRLRKRNWKQKENGRKNGKQSDNHQRGQNTSVSSNWVTTIVKRRYSAVVGPARNSALLQTTVSLEEFKSNNAL